MNRQFGAFTGLAMVLIVLNHAITFGMEAQTQSGLPGIQGGLLTILSNLQAIGIFAVPIFLFVSGSFVSYAAQGDPPRLSSKFLWSSLRHILIPYIIWSMIFYIVLFFVSHETNNFLGYIKNILVGYPYHFIPLLLAYYALSPLMVMVIRRHSILLLVVIFVYQLFTLNVLMPGYLGIIFPAWTSRLVLPVLRTTFADWGIYFPLGLVYGLHAKKILPWLKSWRWILIGSTVLIFCSGAIFASRHINIPQVRLICQTTFVLSMPFISRDQLPWVRQLERVGKRSYGLYLTHLIFLNLIIWLLHTYAPTITGTYFLIFPVLFGIGLFIPLGLMELASRSPGRKIYRYVFG
jgi:peptidoglycan/LPS O-acetylase OafA/YrhL